MFEECGIPLSNRERNLPCDCLMRTYEIWRHDGRQLFSVKKNQNNTNVKIMAEGLCGVHMCKIIILPLCVMEAAKLHNTTHTHINRMLVFERFLWFMKGGSFTYCRCRGSLVSGRSQILQAEVVSASCMCRGPSHCHHFLKRNM